ncbi:hypothetical protein [Herbiconiux sp. L3-i23]|uniref:hypothetical protein n=1 Tax=Herbiconiux sp. L3-i23 TaxID=2905871 RepID=UPI00204B8C26|nr:hypothetical protein [Herbiconiux sp. L3-i23]BDI23544.1 hypothetical protein L3i23_23200 [Herbiconiux sp. L3-i23]
MDRRLRKLSPVDFRSYVMALIWSVSNRTDGEVEPGDLLLIPQFNPDSPPALVREGLWAEEGKAWRIVDFGRDQSSRHELEVLDNVRRADREKKRRQRAAAKKDAVPGDVPRDMSPGTAQEGQDRTGRTGRDSEASGDAWSDVPVAAPGSRRAS